MRRLETIQRFFYVKENPEVLRDEQMRWVNESYDGHPLEIIARIYQVKGNYVSRFITIKDLKISKTDLILTLYFI